MIKDEKLRELVSHNWHNNVTMDCSSVDHNDYEHTAIYYYNLALEDVMKGVKALYDDVPEVRHGNTDDREYGNICGQEQFYEKVAHFITTQQQEG